MTHSLRSVAVFAIGVITVVAACQLCSPPPTTVTAASAPITIVGAPDSLRYETETGWATGSKPAIKTGDSSASTSLDSDVAAPSGYSSTTPNEYTEKTLERLQQHDFYNAQKMIAERQEIHAQMASTPSPNNVADVSRDWAP